MRLTPHILLAKRKLGVGGTSFGPSGQRRRQVGGRLVIVSSMSDPRLSPRPPSRAPNPTDRRQAFAAAVPPTALRRAPEVLMNGLCHISENRGQDIIVRSDGSQRRPLLHLPAFLVLRPASETIVQRPGGCGRLASLEESGAALGKSAACGIHSTLLHIFFFPQTERAWARRSM